MGMLKSLSLSGYMGETKSQSEGKKCCPQHILRYKKLMRPPEIDCAFYFSSWYRGMWLTRMLMFRNWFHHVSRANILRMFERGNVWLGMLNFWGNVKFSRCKFHTLEFLSPPPLCMSLTHWGSNRYSNINLFI